MICCYYQDEHFALCDVTVNTSSPSKLIIFPGTREHLNMLFPSVFPSNVSFNVDVWRCWTRWIYLCVATNKVPWLEHAYERVSESRDNFMKLK